MKRTLNRIRYLRDELSRNYGIVSKTGSTELQTGEKLVTSGTGESPEAKLARISALLGIALDHKHNALAPGDPVQLAARAHERIRQLENIVRLTERFADEFFNEQAKEQFHAEG